MADDVVLGHKVNQNVIDLENQVNQYRIKK